MQKITIEYDEDLLIPAMLNRDVAEHIADLYNQLVNAGLIVAEWTYREDDTDITEIENPYTLSQRPEWRSASRLRKAGETADIRWIITPV